MAGETTSKPLPNHSLLRNPLRSLRDRQFPVLGHAGATALVAVNRGSTTFGAPARMGLVPSKIRPTSALVLWASLYPAPGRSSSPRAPRGAATSPPLPGPGEAALPVNSPPRAAPSPPRLHPRGTLGGVRLARTRCHSPDASPPSFPTAGRPAVLLVHGGAAAEGSAVLGSLAHAGRSARSLT